MLILAVDMGEPDGSGFWTRMQLSYVDSQHIDVRVLAATGQAGSLAIGQLHDDDIWLQLPEFISVLLCYLNLSMRLRIKEQYP